MEVKFDEIVCLDKSEAFFVLLNTEAFSKS